MKYIAESYLTCFSILLMMNSLFEKKNRVFNIIYPISASVGCYILFITSYGDFYVNFVHGLLYFLIPVLLIRKPIKKILYTCFVCVGTSSSIISLVYISVFCFSKSSQGTVISIIISVIIFAIIYVFIVCNKRVFKAFINLFDIIPTFKLLFPIVVWMFLFLLSAEYTAMCFSMYIELRFVILFITILLLVASIILFAYLIINNLRKQHYERLSAALEENIKKQTKYYENVIRTYNNLRTFKHDYKNLKIGLNNLLKTGNVDGAIKYLNKAEESFKTSYQFINTGNTVVDAILSDKQNEIIQNNIKIIFTGIIPYDALEIADLCVVLGNSIDNAVEACAKLPCEKQKNIKIDVKKNRELLIIKIVNPVLDKVVINNNIVRTTKADSEVHGIGFYSINNIVKKYEGFYEIECDETHFTLSMGFMINQKSSDKKDNV